MQSNELTVLRALFSNDLKMGKMKTRKIYMDVDDNDDEFYDQDGPFQTHRCNVPLEDQTLLFFRY